MKIDVRLSPREGTATEQLNQMMVRWGVVTTVDATITQGGEPYDLSQVTVACIRLQQRDVVNILPLTITDATQGQATFELNASEPGVGRAEISLIDTDGRKAVAPSQGHIEIYIQP